MKKGSLIALVFGCLLAAAALLFVIQSPTLVPAAAGSAAGSAATPKPRQISSGAPLPGHESAADSPREPRPLHTAAVSQLALMMDAPVSIEDGGAPRQFQLSTSELSIRDRDGERRILALAPANSAEAFAATIEKIRSGSGNEPELVLYPAGLPRNEFTRRIVTREVVIEASSRSEADDLAASGGLAFKSAPVYANGKFLYEAPSSLEALAFFVQTPSPEPSTISPLLASLMAKRVMPNDTLIQKQWHLRFQNQPGSVSGTDVNVESVWNYPSTRAFVFNSSNNTNSHIRGKGVAIGIVDDGMQWSHPDLQPNVLRSLQKDWNGKDSDPRPGPSDDHGTACAGVAAARGNNKLGVCGVAPEANLVGLRLIGGPNTDADEAESIAWMPDSIHIKSNSWGPADDGRTLEGPGTLAESALEYATRFGRAGRGSILTWAGGNGLENEDASNYDGYANSIYTIAVAAVDSLGRQSYYSEPGANLVIAAPSNGDGTLGILTTDNKGRYGYNPGFTPGDLAGFPDATETFGGTSSATPAVSGVIALMLQRNPNLGWRDVQEILIRSAAQVDAGDPGWITANRTDHVSSNRTVEFHFNDKFGAGLVDAAAAVALSGNWTNLKPQMSRTVTRTVTRRIDPATALPVNTTFTVGSPNFRVEHATLQLDITEIPKGDLTITLTSPQNTVSTFCVPHTDQTNTLTNWKFMTVRNWGEEASGIWQLGITNNGTLTGNLTRAELVVYGAELPSGTPAANPAPTVTLVPSATRATISTNITLNATVLDLASNGTAGNVTKVEFFQSFGGNTTKIGEDTTAPYSLQWSTGNLSAGNHTLTANATDSEGATGTSANVTVQLDAPLVAGWDFQTSTRSTVPLTTALYGTRTYRSNFGTGNATLLLNGSNGSSRWEVSAGQIFSGAGSDLNLGAGFSGITANPAALLLRGGKNVTPATARSLVFQIDLTKSTRLVISYAVQGSRFGFTTHLWEYFDTSSQTWKPIATRTLRFPQNNQPYEYYVETLPRVVANTGFYGNANARVRLTVSGATGIEGTNLLDNITFTATRLP